MIRATTGGVLKSYRANLMNSFIGQNKARDTVLSQRVFNSYADDPAAAAKAFRLRKSRMTVESQYTICNGAISKYQSAFTSLDTIDKLIDTKNGTEMSTLKDTTLQMLNDPKGEARTQLTKALDQLSETIVQNMNQKYADNFIFAGADGHNVPFEVKDNKLYYRGVWVDAAEPNVCKIGDDPILVDENGKVNVDQPFGTTTATGNYYLKTDNLTPISKEEYAKLYSIPNVVQDANGLPVRYGPDGTQIPPLDPDVEPETHDIYYQRADENGDPLDPPEFITTDQYNEEVARANDPPQRLEGVNNAGDTVLVEADENGVPTPGGDYYLLVEGEPQAISETDYNAEKLEAEKLKFLAGEKQFVDIGLGFQEDENGNLIESSGFNVALNGLTFLGYGKDADGDPKNIYSLVQEMRKIADSVPVEGLWPTDTYEQFRGLVLKLEDASSEFKTQFIDHTASTTKLENNAKLLENNHDTLQLQYSELEDVDMADAITSFLWASYCYNAALKMGNSVLSESLMDYLS